MFSGEMVEDLFQQLCQLNFVTGDSDVTTNNKFFWPIWGIQNGYFGSHEQLI